MRDFILELFQNTRGLGFIDVVKITDNSDETKIEAIDEDKTVIVKAKLKEPLGSFNGEFGINNISLLKGLATSPTFKAEGSTIEVLHQEDPSDNSKKIPSGLLFKDSRNQTAIFRFMNPQIIPPQPIFKGTTWDVEIVPSQSNISEFMFFAQLYSSDNLFMAYTKNNNLYFCLGDPNGTDHNMNMVFSENVSGDLPPGLNWPTSQVLSILKVGSVYQTKMFFSKKGALMIEIDTHIANWKYILPAKRR